MDSGEKREWENVSQKRWTVKEEEKRAFWVGRKDRASLYDLACMGKLSSCSVHKGSLG